MIEIYDESGIIIGEASPLSGIIVEDHQTVQARNDFVLAYLIAKEQENVCIRECW